MITVSSLLDDHWHQRYKQISKLNIRSSIYDVTNQCNLRCKGCFFFSSNEDKAAAEEKDITKWQAFIEREKAAGIEYAISAFDYLRKPIDNDELLADELVIRLVVVETFDNVVAVPPSVAVINICLVAATVGITRDIEPMSTPALAKVLRT